MAHLGCDGRVLTVDPQTLDEVIDSIVTIGRATGHAARAEALAAQARGRLAAVARAVDGRGRPGVVVVEWTAPPFCAGHWVPDMVVTAGGTALLGLPGQNSMRIAWEDVAEAGPDLVVVAPCGYRLEGAVSLAEEAIEAGHLPQHVAVWAVDADAASAACGRPCTAAVARP